MAQESFTPGGRAIRNYSVSSCAAMQLRYSQNNRTSKPRLLSLSTTDIWAG